jgi:hypothetical protein
MSLTRHHFPKISQVKPLVSNDLLSCQSWEATRPSPGGQRQPAQVVHINIIQLFVMSNEKPLP